MMRILLTMQQLFAFYFFSRSLVLYLLCAWPARSRTRNDEVWHSNICELALHNTEMTVKHRVSFAFFDFVVFHCCVNQNFMFLYQTVSAL